MAAESRMIAGLRPAFKSLIQTITQHHPRAYWLSRYDNEAFAAIHYLVEYHNLFEKDASFSENFYGLKRKSGGVHLTPLHRHLSLATLVLFPYLKSKVDDTYNQFLEDHMLTNTVMPIWMRVYPVFKSMYDAVCLLYQVLFMFGKTQYFSPLLHLIGVRVVRLSLLDALPGSKPTHAFSWLPFRLLHKTTSVLASYFKWMLLGGVFAFKILEWWYQSEASLNAMKSLHVPPPPPLPKPSPLSMVRLNRQSNICSICRQTRRNPACTPTGFVFCWLCIFNFVKDHQKCPITNRPCTERQIRKIYEN